MGFLYPLIGLLCFFIPICCPPTPEKRRKLNDFAEESDPAYEEEQIAYRQRLKAANKKMQEAMNRVNNEHQ